MEHHWDSVDYAAHGSFIPELGRPLLSLLAIEPGQRILDLGCGDGTLTLEIQQQGAKVVGIDFSPDMVKSAKGKGLDARVGDGRHLHFHAEFDAVFSNAALHWMTPPQNALDGVFKALKPGGKFVGEMGGKNNIRHIIDAISEALTHAGLDPNVSDFLYFPDEDEYRARLIKAGFNVMSLELYERPTFLPTGIEPWLTLFARQFLLRLPGADRPGAIRRIVNALEPYLKDTEGRWHADYVRLRFEANKPV